MSPINVATLVKVTELKEALIIGVAPVVPSRKHYLEQVRTVLSSQHIGAPANWCTLISPKHITIFHKTKEAVQIVVLILR
jgi:hypothetical protein